MLLVCPDCGRNVSDAAESCPNCGYPVSKISRENHCMENHCIINGKDYDLTECLKKMEMVQSGRLHFSNLIALISVRTKLCWDDSQKLTDIILITKKIPEKFDGKLDLSMISEGRNKRVTCPHCGSTSISTINGETYHDLFGGFKSEAVNVCQSCGYRFKPGRRL